MKNYPIPSHRFARQAALAALAASRQNKYKELTDLFLKNYRKLNDETIKKYAEEVGLDMKQFEKDYADPSLNDMINEDMALAKRINVRGVPAIYINGKAITILSLDSLKQTVEKEISKIK
jgi:predicted DsbA family dithiol-disulfide isomerase